MDVIVFMSFIGDLEDLEVIKFRKCSLWSPRSVKRAKTKFPRFGAVVPKGSKDLEIQHFDVKLGKAPQIRNEVAQVLVVTGQQFQQLGIPLSTYCCFAIIIFVLSAEVIDAPTHQKKRKQECKSPVFKGRKVFKGWSCIRWSLSCKAKISHFTAQALCDPGCFSATTRSSDAPTERGINAGF